MSGTKEGARKRLEKLRKEHDPEWFKQNASKAGKAGGNGKGYASEKVGKDGLTGRQRAALAGKKGGQLSSANFKNDPERARKLSKNYWRQKGETDAIENTEGR